MQNLEVLYNQQVLYTLLSDVVLVQCANDPGAFLTRQQLQQTATGMVDTIVASAH